MFYAFRFKHLLCVPFKLHPSHIKKTSGGVLKKKKKKKRELAPALWGSVSQWNGCCSRVKLQATSALSVDLIGNRLSVMQSVMRSTTATALPQIFQSQCSSVLFVSLGGAVGFCSSAWEAVVTVCGKPDPVSCCEASWCKPVGCGGMRVFFSLLIQCVTQPLL